MAIDCIVNSVHGGENVSQNYSDTTTVADCIYKAGGRQLLLELCKKIYLTFEGEVIFTKGYDLPAKCKLITYIAYSLHRHVIALLAVQ